VNRERETALRKILLTAYPDRVTLRRANDPARGLMVGGRGVVLEPSCVVRQAPLFLSIDPRDTAAMAGAGEARVSLASAIDEAWLEELLPHLIERRTMHRFDETRGKVMRLRQTIFAGLVVREEESGARGGHEGASEALFETLQRDVEAVFKNDESAVRLLARLSFLRRQMPELGWPEMNHDDLEEILREACAGAASLAQVHAHGLARLIESRLSWKQRAALDQHAPEAVAVPSGSRIRLQYADDGAAPILAARLQELFGWAETPRLAAGRAPVLLHLLGPNYRPVQVTMDLKNFWNTTYAEVRKNLRARYPKHPWPEDPWNAPAAAVGRRRRRE